MTNKNHMAVDEFIGRHKELKFLEECYDSPKSEFIPIYGRRRVGKSELIRHFIKGKYALYFLGKKEPSTMLRSDFLKEAARQLNIPLLESVLSENWRHCFELILSQKQPDQKLVIVLDEFQWIAKTNPEIISLLQELWDLHWQKSREIFIILCGSYMGFMEKEILGKKSPLFGRRTGQIKLMPFYFREAALFHPRYSLVDKARTYFLCGGIPLYLKFFSQSCSVETNIRENYLNEFAPLFREAEFLLREELKEVEKYHGILKILSSARLRSSDIAGKTGIDPRNMPYYLQQLIDLGYVSKKYPLWESKASPRQVRYQIADPVLKFWFKYVFPNLSTISRMGKAASFRELVKNDLPSYFGQCFESLCREALATLYMQEGVHTQFEIGEYWDKQVQIYVVGLRGDNWTDIGECKWGPQHSLPKLISEIKQKIDKFPNNRGATICGRIFTIKKAAKSRNFPEVRFHSLEDLYATR